jgi:hypothetical protein
MQKAWKWEGEQARKVGFSERKERKAEKGDVHLAKRGASRITLGVQRRKRYKTNSAVDDGERLQWHYWRTTASALSNSKVALQCRESDFRVFSTVYHV